MDVLGTDLNRRKRKRSSSEAGGRSLLFIDPPGLTHPRSIYENYVRDSPACSEAKALEVLLDELDFLHVEDDYVSVSLNEFEIYRSERAPLHPLVLTPLNDLKTRSGVSDLLFDGLLSFQGRECRVEGVPFDILSVDGYLDNEEVSVANKVCIRSPLAQERLVWYELCQPSKEYHRFHEPFLWLVDFTRYFVNFLDAHENVRLLDFRSNFHTWLVSLYGNDTVFNNWLGRCGRRQDFRIDITAHFEFLWKEAVDIDKSNRRHKIWKEVDPKYLDAIKFEKMKEKNTIVTPYVFDCFRNMYFAECLEARAPEPDVARKSLDRMLDMGFAGHSKDSYVSTTTTVDKSIQFDLSDAQLPMDRVQVGDVVGIPRDVETRWKDNSQTWYAYVQGITFDKSKRKLLKVIWLYRPSDTTCANMTYPYQNELFFSDNCNCGDGRFYETDGKFKLRARLFPKVVSNKANDVFIRQTYLTDEAAFVTLKPEHCQCAHLKRKELETELERINHDYVPGDTVLVKIPGHELLEPCRIVQIGPKLVTVQRFHRRQRDLDDIDAKPNEIVHTTELQAYSAKRIIRRCYVRITSVEQARSKALPPPYSYDGAADCWLLTGALGGDGTVKPVTGVSFQSLIEGFDPEDLDPTGKTQEPLAGLGLFSGGGSFDRGLEEGGMVRFKTAIDLDQLAIHTYSANIRAPEETNLFYGSVNDHLAKALSGLEARNVPQVGTILFICAGSPCQGVSGLQIDRNSSRSLKNTSLVTSFVSYIDLYRPKYALFENVYGLRRNLSNNGNENVLSQIICAIVGMGYQVQTFNVDAWSHGPSQSRSRLFIAITAPGLIPWIPPHQTHSHPPTAISKSLGITVNGLSFGDRRFEHTPFSFTTAEEATRDLPWLGDGAVTVNPVFPDHRVTANKVGIRSAIPRSIARFPFGCGWKQAVETGRMPKAIVDDMHSGRGENKIFMSSGNKAWTRVRPQDVFQTITTNVKPDDARGGQWIHWEQNRLITLQEARRAQGIPDNEVLIGLPSRQWKTVGNGVARQVAVAFGMSLREACLANDKIPYQPPPEVVTGFLTEETSQQSYSSHFASKQAWRRFSQGLNIHQHLHKPIPLPEPNPLSEPNPSLEPSSDADSSSSDELASSEKVRSTTSAAATVTPPTSLTIDSSSESEHDRSVLKQTPTKHAREPQLTLLPSRPIPKASGPGPESDSADSDLIVVSHRRLKQENRQLQTAKEVSGTIEIRKTVLTSNSGSISGWFNGRRRQDEF